MKKKKDNSPESTAFGSHIRRLRKASALTLQDVSNVSGLAVSTISKIETSNLSPTYDVLLGLAKGLNTDVSSLFDIKATKTPPLTPGGRLAITRAGETPGQDTGAYIYQPIATQLKNKLIDATVVQVTARSPDEFDAFVKHEGDELVFVLSGSVELHTNIYEPMQLNAGDSVYYDAQMEHVYISTSEQDAQILNIVASKTKN
jgi:transcriptional regulator with XRE-family HTH domain